ncbi:MAG: 4'-phosphopantetheinyl transferase superfamily protein [Betaproteobacteria bacterium]
MSVDDLRFAGNVVARALPAAAEGVYAWWCTLAWSAADVDAARAILSPAETARTLRFGLPELRARYVSGRATLRMLLGRWMDVPAEALPIAHGSRGRPHIDLAGAPDFNVSHTRDAAVIAISTSARIGVDLERRDRAVDAARIARKFLTARERAGMDALEADACREHFLRIWTCKEAMSKATGDGLSAPLGKLSVGVGDRELRLDDGPAPYLPQDWRLVAIDVPSSHVATAALWRPSR